MKFKPEEILVLSTENRKLARGVNKTCKIVNNIDNYRKFDSYLSAAIDRDDIKVIIIDSLTRTWEMLLYEIEYVQGIKGRQIFGEFAKQIKQMLRLSSKCNKPIIWLSLNKYMQDELGQTLSYASIQGSTQLEPYFDVVLHTDVLRGQQEASERYKFITNSDGVHYSRSEYGMFPPTIPNDLGFVLDKFYEYYGENIEDKDVTHPKILVTGASGTGKSYSIKGLTMEEEANENQGN